MPSACPLLDFDERILRFGLRHPPGKSRHDVVVDYVEEWHELMVAAKVEQHEAVHSKTVALPTLPWECLGVGTMPCVFWVHIPQMKQKEKKKKKKRKTVVTDEFDDYPKRYYKKVERNKSKYEEDSCSSSTFHA